MKICFKCHRGFPISEFYRHPRMHDGTLGKCKECTRTDSAETYRAKVATMAGRESERRRGRDKYYRLYSEGPNWTSPEAPQDVKDDAHTALGNAVRDGRIRKPSTCSQCRKRTPSRRLHGHHPDYYEPLDVRWLCSTCHRKEHATHPERVHGSSSTQAA